MPLNKIKQKYKSIFLAAKVPGWGRAWLMFSCVYLSRETLRWASALLFPRWGIPWNIVCFIIGFPKSSRWLYCCLSSVCWLWLWPILWGFGDLSQHSPLAPACTGDGNPVVLQGTGACFHNAQCCSALFSLKTVMILSRWRSMAHRTFRLENSFRIIKSSC